MLLCKVDEICCFHFCSPILRKLFCNIRDFELGVDAYSLTGVVSPNLSLNNHIQADFMLKGFVIHDINKSGF